MGLNLDRDGMTGGFLVQLQEGDRQHGSAFGQVGGGSFYCRPRCLGARSLPRILLNVPGGSVAGEVSSASHALSTPIHTLFSLNFRPFPPQNRHKWRGIAIFSVQNALFQS